LALVGQALRDEYTPTLFYLEKNNISYMKDSKLFGLIISAIPTFLFSQDVMVLKNSDEIKAKVIEITDLTILYKKWDNLTGPDYNMKKEDVLFIRYENGTKEVMSVNEPPVVVSNSTPSNTIPSSNGTITKVKSQELIYRGEQDAVKYYKGKNIGTGWLIASCFATYPIIGFASPLVGLVPTIVCSSMPPKDANLNIPPSEIAQNPIYRDAYKNQAHKIKQRKVLTTYGITTLASILIFYGAFFI
jgi:hypothetical protein